MPKRHRARSRPRGDLSCLYDTTALRRALVLVLTGAVDWHLPPARTKEGLDKKHSILRDEIEHRTSVPEGELEGGRHRHRPFRFDNLAASWNRIGNSVH